MGGAGLRLLITHPIDFTPFFIHESQYHIRQEEWLAQAGWIFGRLQVPREKWSSSAIVNGFTLQLSSDTIRSFETEQNDWTVDPMGLPCYLFIPPVPELPNGTPDIETWLRGENLYYYSRDPEGGSAITERERIALGLPSYTSEAYLDYVYWEADAYNFMEQWQKAKGFDYSTAEYAESLGFLIVEAIPEDELRFEDLIRAHSEDVLTDDLMDVDSNIGNTGDHHDSPLSEVNMDVDG
ncbi:hypothetical protein AAF712_010797 [Marasmius tenuissimus]|uniref:Uncharacterized protein n=1 Tax=Marasmius tenuissimus TaxID=585030 RepID=A0ABR2ZNJ8_9AGAR